MTVTEVFLHGALRHDGLRRAVLGRDVALHAATLPGHALRAGPHAEWPLLVAEPGSDLAGAIAGGLAAEDLARLDHHEAVLGQQRVALTLGGRQIWAYAPLPFGPEPGAPIAFADWAAHWGEIAAATAGDVMALYGTRPAAEIAARYHAMLVRGASRVRAAAAAGPSRLRRRPAEDDIALAARRQPYANFFALEEYDLSYRRFDGAMSAEITRAVFISGDAVTVLPYDPVRDRVLLIEQFRAGALVRGDGQPWQLEAVAGRIDPGETPEEAGRREAVEEAGLTLGEMFRVASYYPSVGAKTEYLYSYVALADLPDGTAGHFGLEGEAEDIRGHLVGFDDLMALVASGEIDNAPVILTAWWLAMNRDRLRAGGAEGAVAG